MRPSWAARNWARPLSSLVRTPSVNPGMSELAMVEEIERQLPGHGCELTRVESMPGRPSLAAVLPAPGTGRRLVLNGHMDTVAIDDESRWSVDPFGGEIRDGHVWGRGVGGHEGRPRVPDRLRAGAEPDAGRAEWRPRPPLRRRRGVRRAGDALSDRGGIRRRLGDHDGAHRPDIATAERGTGWFRILLSGRSTHAATPAAGANPIPPLEDVLAALRRYAEGLASRTHPLLGHPICTVTMVPGGAEHNAISDGCELTIDRRMIPGEIHEEVEEEIRKLITDAVAGYDGICARAVAPIHHPFEAAEIPTESPFIETVVAGR